MSFGMLSRGVSFTPEKDIPDLSGKVIFITGGNVGLGKETVLQLSKHKPARIYLSARNKEKAEATIKDIQSTVPDARISFIQCDLTSLKSVQAAAREYTSKEDRLDTLILNAGIMATPPGLTTEGYEIQFGTNHVGHALLTKLLLPTLLKTAEQPGADVRVILLSSIGHLMAPGAGIVFEDLKTDMHSHLTLKRYAQSKLANILFAKELDRCYNSKGITAVAVHPGVVNTELYRTVFSGYFGLGKLLDKAKGLFYTSVQDGAKNQLWAAVGRKGDNSGEVKGGEYYTPVGISGQGSKISGDSELAERLWEWTEKELEEWVL